MVCLLADSTCNDVYLRRRHCWIGKKLSSGHANDPIDRILPHFSCHHVFMYILLILCFMIDRYPPSFSWQHVYQHFIKRNFYGNLLYLFCRGWNEIIVTFIYFCPMLKVTNIYLVFFSVCWHLATRVKHLKQRSGQTFPDALSRSFIMFVVCAYVWLLCICVHSSNKWDGVQLWASSVRGRVLGRRPTLPPPQPPSLVVAPRPPRPTLVYVSVLVCVLVFVYLCGYVSVYYVVKGSSSNNPISAAVTSSCSQGPGP